MSQVAAAPGWCSDSLGRYPRRYWTGDAWSQWISTGRAGRDPRTGHGRLGARCIYRLRRPRHDSNVRRTV